MAEYQFSENLILAGEAHRRAGTASWERAGYLYEEFLAATAITKVNNIKGPIPNYLKGGIKRRYEVIEDMHNHLLKNGYTIPKSTIDTDIRVMENMHAHKSLNLFINNTDYSSAKLIMTNGRIDTQSKCALFRDLVLNKYKSPRSRITQVLKGFGHSKVKPSGALLKSEKRSFKINLGRSFKKYIDEIGGTSGFITFSVWGAAGDEIDNYEKSV